MRPRKCCGAFTWANTAPAGKPASPRHGIIAPSSDVDETHRLTGDGDVHRRQWPRLRSGRARNSRRFLAVARVRTWPSPTRFGGIVFTEAEVTRWRRGIRGAIGMGLTWAAAWGGAGTIMALGILLVTGGRHDPPFPLMFGAFGFVAGVMFAGVLRLVEGRRRFDQMSLPRPIFAVAAAGFAAGSLALARWAQRWRSLLVPLGADIPSDA